MQEDLSIDSTSFINLMVENLISSRCFDHLGFAFAVDSLNCLFVLLNYFEESIESAVENHSYLVDMHFVID